MIAHGQSLSDFPSLEPVGETAIAEDRTFEQKCLSRVEQVAPGDRWRLGTPLLTKSDKWGLIWRADFTIAGVDISPLVNRIVCWQSPSGDVSINIAIGQRLAVIQNSTVKWNSAKDKWGQRHELHPCDETR